MKKITKSRIPCAQCFWMLWLPKTYTHTHRIRERKKARNINKIPNTYFAVAENVEQQWQTLHDELLTVVVRTYLKEIL